MAELRDLYKQRHPALRRAMRRLRTLLRDAEARIEDKTLVRAQLSSFRIKKRASLERKARKNGWIAEEAFTRSGDLVGGRVVCNNTEDVYRFAELFKELLPGGSREFSVQDYISEPNCGGYRALHVNFMLEVSDSLAPDLVPCEVQIRTRLQDAWGELTHGDIYKQEDLPEDLRARTKDLAEVLAAADKIASDIRRRAVQESTAPEKRPDLRVITSTGLAFVFKEIFGRSPPNYVVRQALNDCEGLEVSSLERLHEVLARSNFRDEISRAYESIMSVPANPEQVFLAGLHALARGDRYAFNYIRRKARREFREIEAVYRREMLSSLPGSIDELIARLEDPSADPAVEAWAATLDSTDTCKVCGTTIVRIDALVDALIQQYEPSNPDEARERIESALYGSSIERGGWGDSSLCSYHDDRAGKD